MKDGAMVKWETFYGTIRSSYANRRPINVSLSLRITRSRPVEPGICTCTKRDDRRAGLIRNKSISRPPDCRLNDSTAIQLTVSSWLSNNTRSFDEDGVPPVDLHARQPPSLRKRLRTLLSSATLIACTFRIRPRVFHLFGTNAQIFSRLTRFSVPPLNPTFRKFTVKCLVKSLEIFLTNETTDFWGTIVF